MKLVACSMKLCRRVSGGSIRRDGSSLVSQWVPVAVVISLVISAEPWVPVAVVTSLVISAELMVSGLLQPQVRNGNNFYVLAALLIHMQNETHLAMTCLTQVKQRGGGSAGTHRFPMPAMPCEDVSISHP